MEVAQPRENIRLSHDAGIAIGPILFIIAILAILAAAIAAGSGFFTAGTSQESARAKASALIQIGENLKIGMDRVTMANGVGLGGVTIDVTSTANNNDLFSPTGGGISPALDRDGKRAVFGSLAFMQGALPNLGTSSVEEVAAIKIDDEVCNEINVRAGNGNTPAIGDYGNLINAGNTFTPQTTWPLAGKTIGCVNNNNTSATGFFFYNVLYVQ